MELLIGFVGLALSFLFAGAETAFITTNKIRFELWLRNKYRSAIYAEKFFRDPELFISTTLVGNNIANIVATSYATVYLINYFSESTTWLLITAFILIFGEILPKALFRIFDDLIILIIIYPIRFFHFLLKPFIWIVNSASTGILNAFGMKISNVKVFFSKEDVAILMNEGKMAGIIEERDHKIISKVLELPDTPVREAMVPRTQIEAVDIKLSIAKIRIFMSEKGFAKVPVYKNDIDHIIGVIFMYDLFQNIKSVKEVMKPVTITPENKKCNELLKEFRKNNTSIAVVIDEYGGTAGLVTTEDLIEELFGEFDDASVGFNETIKKINKNTWEIDAIETIETINDQLKLKLPEENYETISGLILSELGRIPEIGEQMVIHNCSLVITQAKRNKIEKVRLIKRYQ
ncbi:MAG: HlyC/CorC family transporter [Calditrichia bacterium]|nr:HlyC/CorC family transporter [Calditrichia bacterium]